MIAEVIVDIAHSEVDKIFEYRAGENVRAGSRVKVPFSRGVADGYVMRLKETSDFSADRLKNILSVVDEIPVLTEECLQLAYSIAERYKCPKALVLRLFLPQKCAKGAYGNFIRAWRSIERIANSPPARTNSCRRWNSSAKTGVSIILPCAKVRPRRRQRACGKGRDRARKGARYPFTL